MHFLVIGAVLVGISSAIPNPNPANPPRKTCDNAMTIDVNYTQIDSPRKLGMDASWPPFNSSVEATLRDAMSFVFPQQFALVLLP